MTQPTVTTASLADFVPQQENANSHTPRGLGLLDTSIREDGWIGAITVAADGETFDGSARIETGVAAGFDDAIVVETDGSKPVIVKRTDIATARDPRARRLGVKANAIAAADLAWDADVLAAINTDLPDFLATVFRADELGALLAGVGVAAEPGDGGDEYDAAPDPAQTRVQPGDVWQCGEHIVACLDSTDPAAVARVMGGAVATFVWADPPYGIDIVDSKGWVGGGAAYDIPFGGVKNRRATVGGPGRDKPVGSKAARATDGGAGRDKIVKQGLYLPVIGDDSPETAMRAYTLYAELYPQAVRVWWGANNYTPVLPPSTCWIVWDKENTGSFADAELAYCSHESAVRIFRHMWNGLMKDSERGERRIHPTQKPIALPEWTFGKYGKPGDIIVDPFLGSGISLIAAERLGDGRRVVGFELSAAYCAVTIARWEAETGRTATIAPTP